jgi:uncharacterized protein
MNQNDIPAVPGASPDALSNVIPINMPNTQAQPTSGVPSSPTPLELACPQCKKTVCWTDAFPYRPFCSHRCQLIDLGEWASEQHKIPGAPLGQQPMDELED